MSENVSDERCKNVLTNRPQPENEDGPVVEVEQVTTKSEPLILRLTPSFNCNIYVHHIMFTYMHAELQQGLFQPSLKILVSCWFRHRSLTICVCM